MRSSVWEEMDNATARRKEVNKNEKQPCLHDACPQCHGTGKKEDGTICVHHISCPCPKCTPRM
jgi:hypothetical protein